MEFKGRKLATLGGAWATLERAAVVALVVLGWRYDTEGARNVVGALLGVKLALVWCCCASDTVQRSWAAKPNPARCWLSRITWFVLPPLVPVLVWHGAFVVAAVLALLMLMSAYLRDRVATLRLQELAKAANAAAPGAAA